MFSRMEDEKLEYQKFGRKQQTEGLQQRNIVHRSGNVGDLGESTTKMGPENSFLLPASFVHSKLWASNQVADALALCRKFGKPSLFLTMTTNLNWPEIVSELK